MIVTGDRFGQLVAVEKAHRVGHNRAWLCQCDCGNVVTPLAANLTRGRTKSCGCAQWTKASLQERFDASVCPAPPSDCLLWVGAHDENGYGRIGFESGTKLSTHAAWYLATGEWPKDCLLHRCDTPACVAFSHLREGSQADNVADMMAKGRHVYHRKTHCDRGHPLSGDNLRLRPDGTRNCAECVRRRSLESRARKAAGLQ
jgi:hypothetical protein